MHGNKMMEKTLLVSLAASGVFLFSCSGANEGIWTCHNAAPSAAIVYDAAGELPKGAPKRSDSFAGVSFTGRFANYTKADTWYPTWAADGNLYSPWTDGSVGPDMKFIWSGAGEKARSGYATIEGNDPLHLTVSNYGVMHASAAPFQGRYPCGSLHYNGVWYYGTYGIDQPDPKLKKKFGWYVMGPFAGFHWSKDNGETWTPSPLSTDNPLFDEPKRAALDLETGTRGPFVKMGAPHFVDFGKNMEHSPDGKAYLVGHGARNDDADPRVANSSWVTGDAVYMARVTPSLENMNDRSKYEYFAGHDATGAAIWTKDYQAIQPVFSWNNHAGIVTATYNPGLQKYFMCITDGHIGHTSRKEYTSYILESDSLTGPWNIIAHMPQFGPQAYFLNIPSKFISDEGATMWLCSSANYMAGNENRNDPDYVRHTTPPGCAYSLSLHEFRVNEK